MPEKKVKQNKIKRLKKFKEKSSISLYIYKDRVIFPIQ